MTGWFNIRENTQGQYGDQDAAAHVENDVNMKGGIGGNTVAGDQIVDNPTSTDMYVDRIAVAEGSGSRAIVGVPERERDENAGAAGSSGRAIGLDDESMDKDENRVPVLGDDLGL